MAAPKGKFKGKKYFCHINVDGTTIQSLQLEMFAYFLTNLHLCMVSPLKLTVLVKLVDKGHIVNMTNQVADHSLISNESKERKRL